MTKQAILLYEREVAKTNALDTLTTATAGVSIQGLYRKSLQILHLSSLITFFPLGYIHFFRRCKIWYL